MRCLITTLPTDDLGLLARSLPIADQLRARGHEVLFSSPAAAPSRLVTEAGFRNFIPPHPIYEFVGGTRGLGSLVRILASGRWRRYGTVTDFVRQILAARPRVYPPPTTEVWNVDHAGATMGLLNEGFVRANIEAFRRLMSTEKPDVLVDFWNPLAVIAAKSLGIPVVTVIQADAHPDSGGFIWWKPAPSSLPNPAGVVSRVMMDLDLEPISSLSDLSVGDRTLVVGMPETDPLPDTADVTYLGALLWQKPASKLPPSIERLEGRPVVWVYSGNPAYRRRDRTLDSAVIIEASIDALGDSDWDVVLTTGYHSLPDRLSDLPPNMIHERYVPGQSMAQRSDVMVHHGGYGSCQAALWAGRPSVILPTYSERESNARRMEGAGAAVRVPVEMTADTKRVDTGLYRAAVERALEDGALRARAEELADKLRTFGGPVAASDVIEQMSNPH